ncbi:hypothetical protein LH612_34135, partial [Klebsiella pneumoniae]|nr:hypothetical protein [Klebsiella pneumoniae]
MTATLLGVAVILLGLLVLVFPQLAGPAAGMTLPLGLLLISGGIGWLLFRLPRMPEPQRTEFRAGPIAAAANDALQEGDLDTAQRHVDQLTEQYPHLTATRSAQVAMLEARGEYARATLHLLDYLSSGPDLPPREMSYLLAGLAG